MRQTIDLTWASIRMLLRDSEAILFAGIAPVLFLLLFSLYDLSVTVGGDLATGTAGGSVSYFDFVLPGMLAMGLMNFTMVGIAGSVARYRETQVLRLVVTLAVLGNLTFLALGFAIAGRTSTVDAANNLAGLATLPLVFLSGMFFPLAALPDSVRAVAEWLPITPLIEGMRAVALDGVGLAALGPELALLTGWVLVSFTLARLSFRMGPRDTRLRRWGTRTASVPVEPEPVGTAA